MGRLDGRDIALNISLAEAATYQGCGNEIRQADQHGNAGGLVVVRLKGMRHPRHVSTENEGAEIQK